MTQPILVVGVGPEGSDGLMPAVRERIAQADQLWGGARLLSAWPDHAGEKVVIGADIDRQVQQLRQRGQARVVVLASGDPGFHGIAGTLLRHFPAGELEIIPGISALQWAFARAGLAWNDAIFTSAHARPLAEVVGWAKRVPRLGILTDPQHTPGLIAQALLQAGVDDSRAIVAENLGLPGERLIDTHLSALSGQDFAPLNVFLVIQDDPDRGGWRPKPVFSPRSDEAYAHRQGLITKADVRALSLVRLALRDTDTVWDIGAGSGAMSIEMAELAWRGQVYAVEQSAENLAYIHENLHRFGVLNVTAVAGHAPDALPGLPRPQAVFIGGTGGQMENILTAIGRAAQPGCRVVVNLATLDNLAGVLQHMRALGWSPQVMQTGLAQGTDIAGLTRLVPLNPVFIVWGEAGPRK